MSHAGSKPGGQSPPAPPRGSKLRWIVEDEAAHEAESKTWISDVVRMPTVLEDRMLHTELAGYEAYAQTTRYRLLPGVW